MIFGAFLFDEWNEMKKVSSKALKTVSKKYFQEKKIMNKNLWENSASVIDDGLNFPI